MAPFNDKKPAGLLGLAWPQGAKMLVIVMALTWRPCIVTMDGHAHDDAV